MTVMSNLYGNKAKCVIKPGSHVVHIGEETKDTVVIDGTFTQEINVTQKEAYSNASELKTVQIFNQLKEMSERDYDSAKDPEYKAFLEKVRDYITADSRHGQQEKLTSLINSYNKNKDKIGVSKYSTLLERDLCINGSLDVGDYSHKDEKVTEPSFSGVSGALSTWVSRKNDSLFPHTPSSNDIKQGVGLEDCYMLSALGEMVNKDPKSVTDAMKDNGDGTVTVRFWKGEKDKREPVFITVNKTESRVLGGMNSYASGSLWVQMMEKAYAKYEETMHPTNSKKGMAGISRSTTSAFMNAFTKEGGYSVAQSGFGYDSVRENKEGILGTEKETYTIKNKQAYVGREARDYNGYENLMYKFFDNRINKNNETITVGNSLNNGYDKERQSYTLDHGIRNGHAYSVLKVFEKDGKKYVQLKDPYSTFESKYNEKGELEKNNSIASSTMRAGNDTMGTFNMEVRDFLTCFNSMPGIKEDSYTKMGDITRIYEKLVRPDDKENKRPNFSKDEADKIIDAYLDSKDPELNQIVHDAIYNCSYDKSKQEDKDKAQVYASFLKGYFDEGKTQEEKEALLNDVKAIQPKKTKNIDIDIDMDIDDFGVPEQDKTATKENEAPEKITEAVKEETEKKTPEKDDFMSDFVEISKDDLQEETEKTEPQKTEQEKEAPKKESNDLSDEFEEFDADDIEQQMQEDKEVDAYKKQMKELEDKLKKTRGTFRDSSQYKKLIEEVEKAHNISKEGIEENKNNIIKKANEYLKVKMTEEIRGKEPSDVSKTKMDIAKEAIGNLGGKAITKDEVEKTVKIKKERVSIKDLDVSDKKVEKTKKVEASKDKSKESGLEGWDMPFN